MSDDETHAIGFGFVNSHRGFLERVCIEPSLLSPVPEGGFALQNTKTNLSEEISINGKGD